MEPFCQCKFFFIFLLTRTGKKKKGLKLNNSDKYGDIDGLPCSWWYISQLSPKPGTFFSTITKFPDIQPCTDTLQNIITFK